MLLHECCAPQYYRLSGQGLYIYSSSFRPSHLFSQNRTKDPVLNKLEQLHVDVHFYRYRGISRSDARWCFVLLFCILFLFFFCGGREIIYYSHPRSKTTKTLKKFTLSSTVSSDDGVQSGFVRDL